jgi:hypothetical protein
MGIHFGKPLKIMLLSRVGGEVAPKWELIEEEAGGWELSLD